MWKTVLVLTAGVIAGASIVQGLHAQSKPMAYQAAIIEIKDPEAYKTAIGDIRKRIIEAGGKYLVAAGVAGSTQVKSHTGDKLPDRFVITEWPSEEALEKWWSSAGEKDVKMLSQHATLHLYSAEGMSK
jgi:uncharacterized protein (DUF1330 family)